MTSEQQTTAANKNADLNIPMNLKAKVEERGRRETEIKRREKEIEGHKAFIARFKAKASKARQANSRQKRMG